MALTVGVQTVMDAREVVLVVTGQNKALALSQMIEGGVNHMVTASALQDATNELRVKTVKYFKSIEKVQDEVEAQYGSVASIRMGLGKASAA
jgi:glucosamine-6-phosphate deaminase